MEETGKEEGRGEGRVKEWRTRKEKTGEKGEKSREVKRANKKGHIRKEMRWNIKAKK